MAWLNMLWHSPPSLQHENSKLQALYALASAALQLAVGGLVTDEELEELQLPNRQLHLPMAVGMADGIRSIPPSMHGALSNWHVPLPPLHAPQALQGYIL